MKKLTVKKKEKKNTKTLYCRGVDVKVLKKIKKEARDLGYVNLG